ncbi:MAG: ATP-binding protein [Bacteroidota bacterium]
MIDRHLSDECVDILGQFPALGIIGPRQVGKTTFTKELLSKRLDKRVIYLDLESPRDQIKLSQPQLYFEQHRDSCIIIDEIQRDKTLFPILRSEIDAYRRPGRFILTGSASPDRIRDSSESLAGRIAYQQLTPFNFLEINQTYDQVRHWVLGGFPEALQATSYKNAFRWQSNFIKTYIEKDLAALGLNINPSVSYKLWQLLASQHGNLLEVSSVARALQVSSPTAKRYIEFLSEAFIIRLLRSFETNLKKRLVKSPKVYIRDSGTLHHMLNIKSFDDLSGNIVIGNSWEGYIIDQITSICQDDYEYFFYRTHQGTETDLVLVQGFKPKLCIEIKYAAAPKLTKGNYQAFKDVDAPKNLVIIPGNEDYPLSENIHVVGAEKALTEIDKWLY